MYETKKSAADIFNNDINNLRKLSVDIGKDKNGEVVTIKYFENPQLLVTGSDDKRQTELINTMLAGVILKTNPDDVKLIVIDEMNELDRFNGLPHLLWPVITDTKKALETLKWVRDEKNHRGVNIMCFEEPDIMGYNALAAKKVPFIVLVINGMKKLLQKNEAELKEIMSSFLWEPVGNCQVLSSHQL